MFPPYGLLPLLPKIYFNIDMGKDKFLAHIIFYLCFSLSSAIIRLASGNSVHFLKWGLNMKKFAALVLATMLIFILGACFNETASDNWTFASTSGYLYSEDDTSVQSEENGTSSSHANDNDIEPFTPTSDSTWGDLHRHFDPEGFEELPKEIQEQLDSSLLEDVGKSNGPITETTIDDWTIVSTEGYLYPDN